MAEAIQVFVKMVDIAFPYAFVFAFGSKLVNSFLRMAFDGEVRL